MPPYIPAFVPHFTFSSLADRSLVLSLVGSVDTFWALSIFAALSSW